MTDEAIGQFLNFIGEVLDRDEQFTVLWDVRGRAFPSMKQFKRVIAYLEADGRSEKWDKGCQGNAAIIKNPILRVTANVMASIAAPPQPFRTLKTEEAATAWTREKCNEVHDWTGAKSQS